VIIVQYQTSLETWLNVPGAERELTSALTLHIREESLCRHILPTVLFLGSTSGQ